MKGIIVAEFPAPYRVSVFNEMQKKYDIDVFFLCLNESTRSKDYSERDYNFSAYFLDTKAGNKRFNYALRNVSEYDFALAYNFAVKPGIRLAFAASRHKIPLFYNADGGFIHHNVFKDIVKRKLVSLCDLYFSSGNAADEYFITYGGDKNKIRHHHFTSLSEKDRCKDFAGVNKKQIKEELGLNPNIDYVISVGQFIERKGFDLLLEQWTNIKDKRYHLLIIGGGELKNNYASFIKRNDFRNVTILDYMEKGRLEKYYLASSLFVLLTREDVWGLVINEAMHYGLPVITTNMCVAGNELVENGVNGYIVDLNKLNSFPSLVTKILSDVSLQKIMSINNVKKTNGESLEKIAISHIQNIDEFFEKLN